MAPGASRRGKRRAADDSEESDQGTQPTPGDYDSESSRRSQPRRRVDATDSETASDEEAVPAPRPSQPNGTQRRPAKQKDGEFKPGSVVRVTVQDFCAYTRAEFRPGPYLNMVIGPNGTGKSTLVNAICLGLGFPPKLLNRADAVSEFIKHGKPSAFVEIELKCQPHDTSNYIIRLKIRRENNSSKFWLDSKEVSQKTIQALVTKELNIQVDNLCQFLPQDRVAAFAGLGEIELLDEMLRAAAPVDVIMGHARLKELYKDLAGVQKQVRENAERLEAHQNTKRNMQADVDRVKDREAAQHRVELLRAALTATKYTEATTRYKAAKEERIRAAARVKRLEEANEPSLREVKKRKAYRDKVAAAVQYRKQLVGDAERAADRLRAAARDADDEVQRRDTAISAQLESYKTKKSAVAEIRRKITGLETLQKNEPPSFDSAEWNMKIRSQQHVERDLQDQIDDLKLKDKAIDQSLRQKEAEGRRLKEQAEELKTREGQQVVLLRKIDPDAAKAWEWLQNHKDEFEKEVFGPPLLTCSVKDARFADHVQVMLQRKDVVCFTAQTKADQAKLSQQFIREMGLSVSLRTFNGSLDEFRPPVRPQDFGFDGFAIDFLEGPPLLLAQFCSVAMLHKSGVSLNELSDSEYQKLDAQEYINSWASGRTFYKRIHRREYGDAGKSTNSRDIPAGNFWKDQPVDSAETLEIHDRRVRAKTEHSELMDQQKMLRAEIKGIVQQQEEARAQLDELKQQKNVLQAQYTRWRGLPIKIETATRDLERALGEMREARRVSNRLVESRNEANAQYLRAALKHSKHLTTIREAQGAWLEAAVRLVEANSDVHGLEQRASTIIKQCELERVKAQAAMAASQEYHAEATRLRTEIAALRAEHGDEFTELARERTPVDVQNEIAAEEERLGMISAVPQNTLAKYDQTVAAIAKLEKQVEKTRGKIEAVTSEIEELRRKWEPKVDGLVAKVTEAFSYNFEQIGCAGEVRLHKDEDFDKWALHVMVSYRPHEGLIRLTATRQSGGERTVATAFFLLALQGSAQAPFRVVDEINQGMDPRNERMVHNRMVEIACKEHGSQYFLVTPKLLTGLRYDEGMTVLCVASGTHMPEDTQKLNFKRCLEVQKGVMAGVRA
ncbi:related to structural maintenance of chromosome protein (SMC) [Cephalotrichum gorgonifer]|uniref:Structural maintenance of chromosomes protein 5 n=1 Tax=Cephalotrichum gorgonifer TaxID=2041049 RepID=A0AAE8MTS2_9PEZI|nr:related to structural maintenance of chromosome protein (SMC) [Cephalotrichum gorgonifer]